MTKPYDTLGGARPPGNLWPWLAAGVVWTVLVGGLAVVTLRNQHAQIVGLARAEAKTSFEKDLAYRSWAAGHGGVYVSPSADTPPNPYLAGIPGRDVTTVRGERLTLVNPAYMTRQVHAVARERYGARGHITSLNPIRPENSPDPWEAGALRSFEAGVEEATVIAEIDGVDHLRFMRPFITEASCLQCHAAQGYQVGQVRGGISVSVPLSPYVDRHAELRRGLLWRISGAWALGIAGLLFLRRTVTGHWRDLADREEWFRTLVEHSGEALFLADRSGRLVEVNGHACSILGYSREELHGMAVGEIDARFRDPRAVAAVWDRLSSAGARLGDSEFRRKDGSTFPVEVLASVAEVGGEPRMLGLVRDVTERADRESVLSARLDLIQSAAGTPVGDLLRTFLDAAEQLTGSKIGFIHFLEEDQQTLSLQVWSTNTAVHMCSAEGRGPHYPVADAGMWADAIRQRRPVIHNDYGSLPGRKGLPEGHAPVERELVVPVFRNEKIVAVLGVGNRPTEYTEGDAVKVAELADLVWDIVARKRAEEGLAWEQRVTQELADLTRRLGELGPGIEAVAEKVLDCARALTGSEHGYVSEIDPVTGANVGHTLTAMLGKVCEITGPDQKISFPRREDGAYPKLWGHGLNTGEPFFTNAPRTHPGFSGLPWGHVGLRQFLTVPVKDGDRLLGQIALANGSSAYTDQHLDAVCRVAELYRGALLRRRDGAV